MDKGGREGLGLGRMLPSKCFLFVMRQQFFHALITSSYQSINPGDFGSLS